MTFEESNATESRFAYGLFATLANGRRVPLPLKAIDVRFEVAGDCAEVVLEQLFEFTGPNPVDVIYVFPLPADASVNLCEMRVGGRKVVAVAKPVAQARADAAAAHAKGHRTALVESVRDNLFELNLGNVQPGDAITVRISYLNPLLGDGDGRRLRIPTCPGIRYIPGAHVEADGGTELVPDAGRLNPIRIGEFDPDAAAFFCAGTLLGTMGLHSPSHRIELLPNGTDGKTAVLLAEDSEVPNRDFILTWEAADDTLALVSAADPEYLLCAVRAPADIPCERGSRDVFLLLDASGSMAGSNWAALVRAVELAVAELASTDRISVTLFANVTRQVTSGLAPVNRNTAKAISATLHGHKPNGGTEFTPAFAETIRQASEANRPVIIVITDGQFGDEARACAAAAKSGTEVHTIGIDANVNESALRKIARRTRGSCILCRPEEELGGAIRQLVTNLLSPAVDQWVMCGDWTVVGNPPALRAGQAALVAFRRASTAAGGPPTTAKLTLRFTDGSERRVELPVLVVDGRSPALFAAKAEVTTLMDAGNEEAAVSLACRFNLLCDGVAFVAIDEVEKGPVATAQLEQPAMEPEDMEFRQMVMRSPAMSFGAIPKVRFLRHDPKPSAPRLMVDEQSEVDCRQVEELENLPLVRLDRFAEPDTEVDSYLLMRCRILAEDLVCYAGNPEWRELVKEILLPWAGENRRHLRLLSYCLRDLKYLTEDPAGWAEAARKITAQLLPFMPELAAKTLTKFLQSVGAP